MFNKQQIKIIYQLLINAQFKTAEAELALQVLEICKICEKDINSSACVGGKE